MSIWRPFSMHPVFAVPLVIASALAIGALLMANFGARGIAEDTRVSRAYEDLRALAGCVEAYRSATGAIPTTQEGLKILVERPAMPPEKWRKTLETIPIDPWGNRYGYRVAVHDGRRIPEILSSGSDGVARTKDDLSSLDPGAR